MSNMSRLEPDWSKFGSLHGSLVKDLKSLKEAFSLCIFSDCFEDLLEGLDDDEDFLDEALLV